MKAFIILLLLAGAGYYGWQHFAAENTAETNDPAANSETAAEDGINDGLPSLDGPVEDSSTLSAELQQLLTDSDARWTVLAEKGDPAVDANAPELARAYTRILRATYNIPALKSTQERIIADQLSALGQKLFYSSNRYADSTGLFGTYTVQSGDILDNIGRKMGMSYQMLNIMRGTNPESSNLGPGDTLKVVHLKDTDGKHINSGYEMHVDKSDYFMDVFIGGIFARRYQVGVGREGYDTPTGTTRIISREFRKGGVPWTHPETKEVFQPGDPRNILGEIWLKLDPVIGKSGLGMHGYTGEGDSVGGKLSHGCIRLLNNDAKELYHTLVKVYVKNGEVITRSPMTVVIVD